MREDTSGIPVKETPKRRPRIKNDLIRGFLAEFLSTFILVIFIETSAVTSLFMSPNVPKAMLMSCIVQGLSVMFAIFVAGGVTGGFLNPAVTVVWCFLGRLKWRNGIAYCVAEYLGAFVASGFAYLAYYDIFTSSYLAGEIGSSPTFAESSATRSLPIVPDKKTAFGTYPRPGLSVAGAWIDQIICTMLLLIGVMAVSDRRNWRPSPGSFPVIVGLMVMLLNLSFSFNAGAAMNPARDFSPRLFSYLVGLGPDTFSTMDYTWFMVPVIGSHVGALLGASIYLMFVEIHWPPDAPVATIESPESSIHAS